jgi:hypothetical protein
VSGGKSRLSLQSLSVGEGGVRVKPGSTARGPNPSQSSSILFGGDVLEPIHELACGALLYGYVGHGRSWRSTVPVLFAGREPDHISRMNLFNRAAFALYPSAARGNDQRLAQRVRVPGGPRSRLERNAGCGHKCRVGSLKKRVDPHGSTEPVCRTLAGGLRACAMNLHNVILVPTRRCPGSGCSPALRGGPKGKYSHRGRGTSWELFPVFQQ